MSMIAGLSDAQNAAYVKVIRDGRRYKVQVVRRGHEAWVSRNTFRFRFVANLYATCLAAVA